MPSSVKDLKVFVATPTSNGQFPLGTLCSYIDTQEACLKAGIDVEFGFAACSLVHHARSLLAHIFLTQKRDRNILFWIDADMHWLPEDFIRALYHSLTNDCVVGVYPRRCDPPAYYVRFTNPSAEPNDKGLIEVDATGMGFACINRRVIEHLSAQAPKLKYPFAPEPIPRLFRCDDDGTEERSEDYAFWADAKEAGYRIWADCQTNLGHIGTKIYRCSAFGK